MGSARRRASSIEEHQGSSNLIDLLHQARATRTTRRTRRMSPVAEIALPERHDDVQRNSQRVIQIDHHRSPSRGASRHRLTPPESVPQSMRQYARRHVYDARECRQCSRPRRSARRPARSTRRFLEHTRDIGHAAHLTGESRRRGARVRTTRSLRRAHADPGSTGRGPAHRTR